MGGSLARVNLPVAVASMGYDAANRMTSRGLNTLTYDANGNLTGDGTNSYTWNARDQLSGMTGASFAYDAGGRRRSKTVGGTGTSFLYDGANAVQETGGAGTANILGGLGMDEMFQRTDAGGTRSFQTDGLGSVLGLMDGAGTVTAAYTYEAFGGATASGAAAANSAGFTGRENDGTGLMFYRARYYSPALGRFISEDPLGFGGGDVNLYAYVGNGPTNAVDPTGTTFSSSFGNGLLSGVVSSFITIFLMWSLVALMPGAATALTTALFLSSIASGISSLTSVLLDPSEDNIGYNLGALVAGVIFGGVGGKYFSKKLSPADHQPPEGLGGYNPLRDVKQVWRWNGSEPFSLQFLTAMSTGPNPLSAAGALAFISVGLANLTHWQQCLNAQQ